MNEVLVSIEPGDTTQRVGTPWTRERRGRQSATSADSEAWLADPHRFALEPALTVGTGPHHTGEHAALFGAVGASADAEGGGATEQGRWTTSPNCSPPRIACL